MRSLSAGMTSAIAAEVFRPVLLVRLDFSGGVVAANSGVSSLTYNGDTYLGVGNLGSIDAVQEGSDVRAYGLTMQLSGIPSALISIALGEHYQGRDAKVYLGGLDASHALVGNPVLIFNGRIDHMNIEVGDSATIQLSAESRLADWERPRTRRYNHVDQTAEYPSDNGFEFVDQAVSKEIIWGQPTP